MNLMAMPLLQDRADTLRAQDGAGLPEWLRHIGLPMRVRSLPGLNILHHNLKSPAALVKHIKLALPVTFTPYASTQACSARCVFCSENLRPVESGRHSSQLRPDADYFDGLRAALRALDGVPLGLSLSGLEMTDNPRWFLNLLDVLGRHERTTSQAFTEKILYSNGAGFGDEPTRHALIHALDDFGLERIEWSRHSHIESENDRIMRFRPETRVAGNACFEEAVRDVLKRVPVTLVCLLQQGGVDTVDKAAAYLRWAAGMGIRSVVFREFARPGDNYRPNLTLRTLHAARISCESLVKDLCASRDAVAAGFTPVGITEGYYFWNIEYHWRGSNEDQPMRVVFEASDYQRMHALHASDTVYKLVYHANGHLTADWDPNTRVILRSGEAS